MKTLYSPNSLSLFTHFYLIPSVAVLFRPQRYIDACVTQDHEAVIAQLTSEVEQLREKLAIQVRTAL
jgi:hypothetical protein